MTTNLQELDKLIDEMSSMSGGGVEGGMAGVPFSDEKTLKKFNKDQEKEQRLKGEPLVEEEDETQTEAMLREYIRNKIQSIKETQRKQELTQEVALRTVIQTLIKEVEDSNPHPSTGINKLRDSFKKAKPTIKRFYKQLTTSDDQRQSFSAHLLSAFERMFNEVDALSGIKAGQNGSMESDDMGLSEPPSEESDIKVTVGDEEPDLEAAPEDVPEEEAEEEELAALLEADIFLEQDENEFDKELDTAREKESERSDFGSGLEDMEKTGRNQALDAMKLVRSYFAEPYNDMENEEDKKQYKDWALYNLDLLLNSYEDELQATLQKPEVSVA